MHAAHPARRQDQTASHICRADDAAAGQILSQRVAVLLSRRRVVHDRDSGEDSYDVSQVVPEHDGPVVVRIEEFSQRRHIVSELTDGDLRCVRAVEAECGLAVDRPI